MQRQLVNVQYLRAISACAIVLYHAGLRWGMFIPIGEGRVALFFILSGFLFWWITTGRHANGLVFLAKRLARLVPLYWLVTLLSAILSWTSLTSHGSVTAEHFIKSMLFIPHYGPIKGMIYPVVFPGWTLVYEMFFCILFALLLNVKETYRLLAASAVLGGLTLLGLIFKPTDAIGTTYTNVIMIEFLTGVWIACYWSKFKWTLWSGLAVLAAGLSLSFAIVPVEHILPELVVSGLPALLILCGALGLEAPTGKKIGWLKSIGDGSYSIYLWHIPAFFLATRLLKLMHVTNSLESIAIGTAVGVGAGLVLYRLIEEPLTRWLMARIDQWSKARKQRAKAAAATAPGGALLAH